MPLERIPPLLRWAGGKTQLLPHLLKFVPADYAVGTYREPFLGAASFFFALQPPKAVLSDANAHLVSCYEYVRDNCAAISRYLQQHARKTNKRYYYKIRTRYNTSQYSASQAARFIYLNKTCFNGIFRVNTKGRFNVPYGWKKPPALPSADHLRRAGSALKTATLASRAFEVALEDANRGDFVYLDPPYPPLNGTAYFTHYTADRFTTADQERLYCSVNPRLDYRDGRSRQP